MANKKKTCLGCKALGSDKYTGECILKYPIKMKDKAPLLPEPIPVNRDCPKPRTYEELFNLLAT